MAYQIEKSFRNVVRNCEQKLMREDKNSFDSSTIKELKMLMRS